MRNAQRSWHEAAIDMQSHFAAQLHFSEWKLLRAKSAEAGRQTAEHECEIKDCKRELVKERAKAHELAVDMQSVCALNRKLEKHIEAQAHSELRATVSRDRARQREALLAHMHAIERDEEAKTTAQLHAHIATLHHVIAGLTGDLQDLEVAAQLALEAANSAASMPSACAPARASNLRQGLQTPASGVKFKQTQARDLMSLSNDIKWTAVQQAHLKLHEAKMNKPSPPRRPSTSQCPGEYTSTIHPSFPFHPSPSHASIDKSPRMLRFRKLLDFQAEVLTSPQSPFAMHGKSSCSYETETTRKGPTVSKTRQPLGACTVKLLPVG